MLYRKRLIIFGIIFLAVIIFDGVKFLLSGPPNLINWYSFIHPAWVLTTLLIFFLGIYFDQSWIWRLIFGIQFLVFLAALLNQYLGFWNVLAYNCLLFNLIFVSLYFVLIDK